MRIVTGTLTAFLVLLLSPMVFAAQAAQPSQQVTSTAVPHLVNVSGIFRPADGQKPSRVEVVTLAIYADETGGEPLWQETQSIAVGPSGDYTVLLGATQAAGVPLDVFASGHARWLGLVWARPGEVEGARTRLTSVPYALRASDAATLGGKPASAYQLAPAGGADPASGARLQGVMTPQAVLPGTTNVLAKYVNGADVGDSAVYESAGLVGINTTAPLDVLHARFTNTGGNLTGIAVQNLGNTATSYSGMLFYDHTGALGQFQGFNNSTKEYRINNIATGGTINFMTGSTSRFRISNNGNIGIGTTAPNANLEVSSIGGTEILATARSTVSGAKFNGRRSRLSLGAPIAVQMGDTLASFGAYGYGATDYFLKAQIDLVAAENWTDDAHGTHIWFATTQEGNSGSYVYRMAIDSTGNVGVGTLSPLDKLHVFGDVRVGTGSTGCVKDADGTLLTGVCSSDARLKKDMTPFSGVLGRLTALQPVHYSWRAAEFPARHLGEKRTYGLIAQDVEKVLPDLVVTDDDGYKAVNYSKLPLLTIQAVKELKAENDEAVRELRTENRELKARVAELERIVNELVSAKVRR